MNFDNIPVELKAYKNWVLWKLEERDGKMTKPPYATHGRKASTTSPETWAMFDDVIKVYERGGYGGIGFVFTNTPYIGIDLDDCIVGGGLTVKAADIVGRVHSYWELSQSGKGAHIICRGVLPEGSRRKDGVEMYGHGSPRYFAMTGDVFFCAVPIRECQVDIDAIHAQYIAARTSTGDDIKPIPALELAILNDDVLMPLWNGSRPHGDDESANDMGLMNKLAYYCGDETDAIAAFLSSPHYETKDEQHKRKCDRKDYLPRTFKEALNIVKQSKTPSPLNARSIAQLQNTELDPINWVVAELLPQGLALLVSPPKYGKSWFVLDMCLSVAAGNNFLKHKTVKSGCLYLALEDSDRRLKDRVNKLLFGKLAPDNFDYALTAQSIDNGLIEQLEDYVESKPDTALIVVDTLQKVRGVIGSKESVYGADYREMGALKAFADRRGVCVLLVHHLRKGADDSDPFNRISGTNGIFGSADTAMVMTKNKRSDEDTTLSVIGRDVDSSDTIITFDKFAFRWNVRGSVEELEEKRLSEEYDNDPIVRTINHLVKQDPTGWTGTATELINACTEFTGLYPCNNGTELGRKMSAYAKKLNLYDGILWTRPNKNGGASGRKHHFYEPNPA